MLECVRITKECLLCSLRKFNLELKRQVVDDIRKTVIAFANSEAVQSISESTMMVGSRCKDIGDEMLRLSNIIRDAIKPDVTMFVSYVQEKEKTRIL